MSERESFGGHVRDGMVIFDQALRWRGVLARHEGRRVTITVRREQVGRSLSQNRFWHSVVVPIFGDWAGYDKQESHELLKRIFLPEAKKLPDGEEIVVGGSTARLTKEQFSDLLERVGRWLAGHGVYLPSPGEKVEASL